jgi:hypothetical protein
VPVQALNIVGGPTVTATINSGGTGYGIGAGTATVNILAVAQAPRLVTFIVNVPDDTNFVSFGLNPIPFVLAQPPAP